MIKETLIALAKNNYTLTEIADKLNTTSDEIRQRLDLLKSMKYISVEKNKSNNVSNCGSGCFSCSSQCSEIKGTEKSIRYTLTEKGKRVIKEKQ